MKCKVLNWGDPVGELLFLFTLHPPSHKAAKQKANAAVQQSCKTCHSPSLAISLILKLNRYIEASKLIKYSFCNWIFPKRSLWLLSLSLSLHFTQSYPHFPPNLGKWHFFCFRLFSLPFLSRYPLANGWVSEVTIGKLTCETKEWDVRYIDAGLARGCVTHVKFGEMSVTS